PCAVFFLNDTATTELYTLSLHDALPISEAGCGAQAHPPAAKPDELLDFTAGRVDVGEDPLGKRQEHFSGGGEGDVAADAFEQGRAELPLQSVNLLTQ